MLLAEAGKKTVAATKADKAPVAIFVEETGKTGFAHLIDLADPKQLAQVNPGDSVDLKPDGPRLAARANGKQIGYVEPRVAARLLKLVADGNKYTAGVTSIGERDVRIIIRETYQDPANYGKVSFPTAAKVSDLRPYTKGTLIREEMDLEEELELDDEEDEIEDIGRVLAEDVSEDEAFDGEEATSDGEDSEDEEEQLPPPTEARRRPPGRVAVDRLHCTWRTRSRRSSDRTPGRSFPPSSASPHRHRTTSSWPSSPRAPRRATSSSTSRAVAAGSHAARSRRCAAPTLSSRPR